MFTPRQRRSIPFHVKLALFLVSAVILSGCVTSFDRHRDDLEALHASGRYDLAAARLDDPTSVSLYGRKDRLLWTLDRGAVALALDDDTTTMERLEEAEAGIDHDRQSNAGDHVAQWLLNDSVIPYYAEPYEDMYVNVLKLLAQLEAGRIEGGATVEARRLAGKADMLRDRYVKLQTALDSRADARVQEAMKQAALPEVNNAGEFIESPLGTFLTAVTFMKSGQPDLQSVAGRRLLSSIELQRGLIGNVSESSFSGLGELKPESASVLVVALSGRAPTKQAQRFGPIPFGPWPVYFEVPVLGGGSAEVANVEAIVEPAASSDPDAPSSKPETLSLVEDLGSVATENHNRELPLIYTRAVIRSSLKAAASFAATQAVRNSTHGSSGDAATFGMIIAGLAFVALTEHADLRCWEFLPGQAHVVLLDLPPGDYTLRIRYLSATGGVLHSPPPRAITITGQHPDQELVTIVEHYWK